MAYKQVIIWMLPFPLSITNIAANGITERKIIIKQHGYWLINISWNGKTEWTNERAKERKRKSEARKIISIYHSYRIKWTHFKRCNKYFRCECNFCRCQPEQKRCTKAAPIKWMHFAWWFCVRRSFATGNLSSPWGKSVHFNMKIPYIFIKLLLTFRFEWK